MPLRSIGLIMVLVFIPGYFCGEPEGTEDSLLKATKYLENRGDELLPMMIPTLHHLKNEYGLTIELSALERKAIARNKKTRNPFYRELDPETTIRFSDIEKLSGIDRLTAQAMHCDRFSLPKDYFAHLRQSARKGGYALTHSALALLMIGWRKCRTAQELFKSEISLHVTQLHELLKKTPPGTDLGMEAIVMLLLMQKADLVLPNQPSLPKSWFEDILRAQHPNGSWNNDDHTTVIAMWALLEARRQGLIGKNG